MATFGPVDPRWLALDRLFAPYLPPELPDARTTDLRGPFESDQGVESLLATAGLSDVRTARTLIEVTFTGPERWLAFSWSHGQRAMWEAVPLDLRERVRLETFIQLDEIAAADGHLRCSQDVRYTLGRRSA
ncbi:MAG: hypothetical protein ACR2KL_11015 [Nocardioidaceae bacterium]